LRGSVDYEVFALEGNSRRLSFIENLRYELAVLHLVCSFSSEAGATAFWHHYKPQVTIFLKPKLEGGETPFRFDQFARPTSDKPVSKDLVTAVHTANEDAQAERCDNGFE